MSPSGTQDPGRDAREDEAAIAGDEAGREQPLAGTATPPTGDAVDLADDELADAAVGDEAAERPGRGGRHGRVVGGGQGLERRAAALEVERRDPVDEHDVRAGRALERPPVGLAAARPGERRAVRVGRVGGGEQVDRARPLPGRPARGPRAAGRARPAARTGRPPGRRRSSRAGSGRPPRSPAGPGRPPRTRRRRPRRRRPRGSATPWRSSSASAWAWSRSVGGRRRRRLDRATSARPPRAGRARSAGPAAAGGAPPLPVRFQRSARSGANVSLVTSPAQTRSHSASSTSRSEPPPRGGEQLAVERGAAAAEVLADARRGAARAGRSTPSGGPTGRSGSRPGPDERDPAVVAAEAPPPHPGDLAERAQLVEQPRLVARDPGRQDVALEDRGRDRQRRPAGRRPRRGARGRPCRGAGARRAPTGGDALPGGQEPARAPPGRPARPRAAGAPASGGGAAAGPPGRTTRARRRRAGTRRAAACRRPSSRSSASSTTPDRQPPAARRLGRQERAVGPRPAREQPVERPADRREERLRHADRRRDPDPVAVARDVLDRDPALLAGDPGPDRAPGRGQLRRATDRRPSAPPSVRAATSSADRSPSRRSRSWTPSAVVARRSSVSAWSDSSRSASASGSSSSRSSSWPSSSRSRSRSSVSAPARRSASGVSPSYM